MPYKKHVITKQARENLLVLWEEITTNYKHDISMEELTEILLRNIIVNEIAEMIDARDK